jgi:hypothetical protein
MKTLIKRLYSVFLMPYLERDRYFEELVNETEIECSFIARKILLDKNKGKCVKS